MVATLPAPAQVEIPEVSCRHQPASRDTGAARESRRRNVIPHRNERKAGAEESDAFRPMMFPPVGIQQVDSSQNERACHEQILNRFGDPADESADSRDSKQQRQADAMDAACCRYGNSGVIRIQSFHLTGQETTLRVLP
jgi:hypothetical protein